MPMNNLSTALALCEMDGRDRIDYSVDGQWESADHTSSQRV